MTVLQLLTEARTRYLNETIEGSYFNCGMCYCLKVIYSKHHPERIVPKFRALQALIPEFNYHYLKGDYLNDIREEVRGYPTSFWWDNRLTKPRIAAFDALINLYKDNHKEIEWTYDGNKNISLSF